MTEELSNLGYGVVGITALLPLIAGLLVLQVNPYHALVMRGILGAIAALVYALFGAADVALTEALVGTFLSITLYAVAVRSSLTMRLGILKNELNAVLEASEGKSAELSKDMVLPQTWLTDLRQALRKHHMQLEMITYSDQHALESALMNKEIHTSYCASNQRTSNYDIEGHLQTRVKRLYEIMDGKLSPAASLSYVSLSDMGLNNVETTERVVVKEKVS